MEPEMEITRELLKEKFKEYNRLYFGGKLRAPGFSVIRYQLIAGRFSYRRNQKGEIRDRQISISSEFMWDEDTFRDVMVHEMIHYDLFLQGYRNIWFPHGRAFRKMMRRLNREYGLHIRIRCRIPLKPSETHRVKAGRK